jgi:hypothetical protein
VKIKQKVKKYIRKLIEQREIRKYEQLYGEYDKKNYNEHIVHNLPSESLFYWGELIKWSTGVKPQCVLFVGENRETANILKEKIEAKKVVTAGLSDVDYKWNFEQDPPAIAEEVDLVVSQAILEHLLNPYKHVSDMATLLSSGGHLVIHTVMPGFTYHRHPIDAMRFFPDWFEEVANRLGLEIVKKRIVDTHIFYMYKKP